VPTLPPPDATANVTDTPAIGLPFASRAITEIGFASVVPAIPVCASFCAIAELAWGPEPEPDPLPEPFPEPFDVAVAVKVTELPLIEALTVCVPGVFPSVKRS